MAVLDVWNQALGLARARGRLSSLTEQSPEQAVLAQWYPHVLSTVQSAAWWPGCKAQARLARVAEAQETWENGDPELGFEQSFALPVNLLRAWHLTDYQRFSLGLNRAQGRIALSTQSAAPILTFAVLQEETSLWMPAQHAATIYALAAHIAGPLTGKNTLSRDLYEMANIKLLEAQAQSANDMGDETKPAVPWLQARGYGASSQTRYYYPFGEVFTNAQ